MKRGVLAAGACALLSALGALAARPGLQARAKLRTLEDILASKNDNDPRLDGDFNTLSPEAKSLFRAKYAELPPERRNERGTIVYLLGKNPRAPEDWAFLRAVAAEPPCLSLADCSRAEPGAGGLGDEVTLAYPSLVALRQVQRVLEEAPSREALGVIAAGKDSRSPAVARMAARLDKRFPPQK